MNEDTSLISRRPNCSFIKIHRTNKKEENKEADNLEYELEEDTSQKSVDSPYGN